MDDDRGRSEHALRVHGERGAHRARESPGVIVSGEHSHEHAGHSYGMSADADAGKLTIALALILGFMVLEVTATGSSRRQGASSWRPVQWLLAVPLRGVLVALGARQLLALCPLLAAPQPSPPSPFSTSVSRSVLGLCGKLLSGP
jgi:hypothetical protein